MKIDGALAAARRGASNHRTAIKSLGEGWVGEEALAIGLYSAMVARSFPEAIAIAANHDGDSDSTASIAAQLYGMRRGLSDLPHRWITRLDVKDVMLRQIRRTYFPSARGDALDAASRQRWAPGAAVKTP